MMPKTDLVEGKWQLTESENFEAFMQALGIGMLTRKLGNKSKPLVTITSDGDTYTFKQESLVKTSQFSFKLGEMFDELTADGRKVKSKIFPDGDNVLVHEMKGTDGGKDSTCWRTFMQEKMECVCKVDDITTTRIYQRQK